MAPSSSVRYIVVIAVPDEIRGQLEPVFQDLTGVPIAIRQLHISLGFPFFLKANANEEALRSLVSQIPNQSFQVRLADPASYEQNGKHILHLTVEPQDRFKELHLQVSSALEDVAAIDSSIFDGGVIPPYEAHLTLSYDFPEGKLEDAKTTFNKHLSFPANRIEVLKELEKSFWAAL